uniref:Methyltransf_21 domain-containing protein n=1 Tax=Panagrellus redivivus TaxID=6233 RepID=A0A7E4UT23_PANRE
MYQQLKSKESKSCFTKSAMTNRRISYVLIGVFITAIILLMRQNSIDSFSYKSDTVEGYLSPSWIPELTNAFTCLRKAFKDGTSFQAAYQWYYMSSTVDKCSDKVAKILHMETYKGDEDKFLIPGPTPNFNYTMLTLGVGHSVKAEELILKSHPSCTRYVGVDPDPAINQDLVEKLGGKFLKHVVAVDDNIGGASLLGKRGYKTVQTQHTSFVNVVKEAELTKVIDILIMDIEGAEFGILADMIEHPQKYPTICQMNAEIHNAFENGPEGYAIIDNLHKMALQSRYLLLKVTQFKYSKNVFNRCFFINVKDDYCVKKYASKLFTSA